MDTKFLKLRFAIIPALAFALFAFAGVGQAKAGDLEITLPSPMFGISNFLPGDSDSGQAAVKNISSSAKKIVVWTDNASNPTNSQAVKLGDVLTISIARQGETPFYSEKLTKFLNDTDNAGSIFDEYVVLENSLSAQDSKTYVFKIDFDSSAGNEYQSTAVGFDLNIGSWNDYQNGSPSGKTYFSSGGGAPYFEFEIKNIKNKNIGKTQALISWDTNADATTQIIYSMEGEPRTLMPGNPPYYGYAHAYPLPAGSALTSEHQIFLTNLTPCAPYYYRVVSRMPGREDSISEEKTFATLCDQEEGQRQDNDFGEDKKPKTGFLAGYEIGTNLNGDAFEERPSDEKNDEQRPEDKEEKKKTQFNLLANLAAIWNGIGLNSCWPDFPWWVFLLFAVYPAIKGLNYWNEKRNQKSFIFLLIALVPAITAIWAFSKCLSWLLVILYLIASIVIWMLDRRPKIK